MMPRPNIHQVVPYLCACLPLDLLPELEVLEDMPHGDQDEVMVGGLVIRCPGGESNGWGIHTLEEDGSMPLVSWSWDVEEIADAAARIVCGWRRVGCLEDLRGHLDHMTAKAIAEGLPIPTVRRGT